MQPVGNLLSHAHRVVWQDCTLTLFVLDFSLDILDSIWGFNLERTRDKTESDTFVRAELGVTRQVDNTSARGSVLYINGGVVVV